MLAISAVTIMSDQSSDPDASSSPGINSSPRILFIVDSPNWAHDFKTRNLARVLGHDYDIRKVFQTEVTADDLKQADLIVVYYWLQLKALGPLLPSLERNREKVLVGICSSWELERPRRREGLRVLRSWARAVFVNNLSLYNEYRPKFDVPVFYTPNGVDTGFFRPAVDKKSSSWLQVGWAGSLATFGPGYKGYIELIVPAAKTLDGVKLVSAARENKWRSPEEMREFYHSLDAYVCASRAEGTPNPCLEAAACGIPLLTTRVGNMPELVRHRVNSLFIEPNLKDLAEKLSLLRDSPAVRLSLSQQLHEDIQLWDWSIRAQAYRQMFEELLARKCFEARPSTVGNLRATALVETPRSRQILTTEKLKTKLLQRARASLSLLPAGFVASHREVAVTIVMLSHGRLDMTINAIRALRENVLIPFKLLLVDNGSGPEVQTTLTRICAAYDFIELFLLQENLGCNGGRMYALDYVDTEFLMFLDNDVEVLPGAVEHLLYSLELHPEMLAAMGTVVFPDGLVQLCGGDYWIKDGILFYKLLDSGEQFDRTPAANSGECRWIGGGATVFRKAAFLQHRLDPEMGAYYEDLEWCYRLNQFGPGRFYRNVESLALHYYQSKLPGQFISARERRSYSMRYIETIAHFYQTHGQIIQSLFAFVPELGPSPSPQGIRSARALLELVSSQGSRRVLDRWNEGDLGPLFPQWSLSSRLARKSKAAIRRLKASAGGKGDRQSK